METEPRPSQPFTFLSSSFDFPSNHPHPTITSITMLPPGLSHTIPRIPTRLQALHHRAVSPLPASLHRRLQGCFSISILRGLITPRRSLKSEYTLRPLVRSAGAPGLLRPFSSPTSHASKFHDPSHIRSHPKRESSFIPWVTPNDVGGWWCPRCPSLKFHTKLAADQHHISTYHEVLPNYCVICIWLYCDECGQRCEVDFRLSDEDNETEIPNCCQNCPSGLCYVRERLGEYTDMDVGHCFNEGHIITRLAFVVDTRTQDQYMTEIKVRGGELNHREEFLNTGSQTA
ncbi:hypothetical protein EX30DRAFT_366652 [Ascodesmis nigricans]|uniref:Uncharacterized protein n=1 Tax=Ascodesmis nigricans TaxID=341454 RepID=A0A4S2MKK3_9PEZI|nr:hypothetical protein EX30DRAFT_366652 [Ascodesmis nigricans]